MMRSLHPRALGHSIRGLGNLIAIVHHAQFLAHFWVPDPCRRICPNLECWKTCRPLS